MTSRLPRPQAAPRLALLLAPLLVPLLGSCAGVRTLADPTLVIQTRGGVELGAATDYGVVFLGSTAPAGEVEITAWYGDGPSIERSVIEPIDAGLYTAETEIRLPSVPLSFRDPRPGEKVLVRGRFPGGPWEEEVTVRAEQSVEGLLIDVPRIIRGHPDQIGAGVYVLPGGERAQMRLVGLVSGRLRLIRPQGEREYLTVVGPRHLWRLVTHRRDLLRRRPWIYREDIL